MEKQKQVPWSVLGWRDLGGVCVAGVGWEAGLGGGTDWAEAQGRQSNSRCLELALSHELLGETRLGQWREAHRSLLEHSPMSYCDVVWAGCGSEMYWGEELMGSREVGRSEHGLDGGLDGRRRALRGPAPAGHCDSVSLWDAGSRVGTCHLLSLPCSPLCPTKDRSGHKQKPLCTAVGKEIKPVNPKGNQPWIFIGRTDAGEEAPILWPPGANSWLIGKDPDAGKDWR